MGGGATVACFAERINAVLLLSGKLAETDVPPNEIGSPCAAAIIIIIIVVVVVVVVVVCVT